MLGLCSAIYLRCAYLAPGVYLAELLLFSQSHKLAGRSSLATLAICGAGQGVSNNSKAPEQLAISVAVSVPQYAPKVCYKYSGPYIKNQP